MKHPERNQSETERNVREIRDITPAVYAGPESTTFSIYGTSPENPSGTKLCFLRYPDITRGGYAAPRVFADVCIKDMDTGGVTELAKAEVTNHNGCNAMWIDDDRLAIQSHFQNRFEVYDTARRKRIFRKRGELGHSAVQGLIPYGICNFFPPFFGFEAESVPPGEEGIHVFNPDSGESKQIISLPAIVAAIREKHPRLSVNNPRVTHLDLSPSGDRLLFDYRCDVDGEKQGGFFQGLVNRDGSGCRIIPVRCAHTLWFDNDSFFGPREGRTSRYDLQGKKIEVLGGNTCHAAITSDHEWLSGETKPGGDQQTTLYLYKRGCITPVATVAQWGYPHVTWEWVAHANPAFSHDNKRLYFVRAAGSERFEGCCFDMAVLQ